MALPLLGLIPAFSLEGGLLAGSVGAFVAGLLAKEYKTPSGEYNFDFSSDLEKFNKSYSEHQEHLDKYIEDQVDTIKTQVASYNETIDRQYQTIHTDKLTFNTSENSLTGTVKNSNMALIEQQKVFNNQLTILNKTLSKLFEAKNIEIANQNVTNSILNENLKALNFSVASLVSLPKVLAETQEYNLLVNGQILLAIQEQTKAIENQKLSVTNSVGGTKVDTSALAEANQKIADGVESQKALNEALLRKLSQENAKDITYNGQTYTKTEIEKLATVESLKGLVAENEFTLKEALEVVEDFFTDGFDLNINPLQMLLDSLKDSLKTEFNEINIKYNLGLEDLK